MEEKKKPNVIILGGGEGKTTMSQIEEAIRASGKENIIVVDDVNKLITDEINLDKIALPILKKLSEFPITRIIDESIPNKLQLLKDLKLSPEQIDYFQNAPPLRLEG